MKHKLFVTLASGLVASLTLLAGCGTDDTTPDSSGTSTSDLGVAVFLSTAANSYEQAQADGVKQAAEDLGAGPVQVFDGGFDSTKQIGQIQDATTSGRFKAFIIEPVDGTAAAAPLQRAADEGIAIVCITTTCGPDATTIDVQFPGQAGVVASDYAVTATALAGHAVDACEGDDDCQVFFLNGDSTFPSDRAAKDAFTQAMDSAPSNVQFVGSQDAKYDTATGRGIMQAELQRNPDLDVLVSFADQQTLGAAQAIDAAGKSDNIGIISFGGSEQAVKAVADGTWLGALPTMPFSIGETGAQIAIKTAQGDTVGETAIDANTLTGVEGGLLTQENLEGFKAQWVS